MIFETKINFYVSSTDGYTDADIIELIADEENDIVANIRTMLPKLRKELQ